MDSLSQLALGAAVGIAVMGRRTAVWKAALWGGICGTLPDLDTFISRGDPVSDMTLHRTESHALFYQTLLAPLLAWGVAVLHRERERWGRWCLAVWAALVTHPLLDLMTIYGTQLGLPFTDHPFGIGSVFVIDPLYTLPLLVGVTGAWRLRHTPAGLRWNAAGLLLSTAYLAWGVAVQHHVTRLARQALQAQGVAVDRLLVTPTPFNTVLWRVVAITPQGYAEAYHSLLDANGSWRLRHHRRDAALDRQLQARSWHARRLAWFSHGFYKVWEQDGECRMSDLRMGMEPYYTFTFAMGRQAANGSVEPQLPRLLEARPDLPPVLHWLWQRALGNEGLAPLQ